MAEAFSPKEHAHRCSCSGDDIHGRQRGFLVRDAIGAVGGGHVVQLEEKLVQGECCLTAEVSRSRTHKTHEGKLYRQKEVL